MPKKKIEVYTLHRLLKEAHALLVKYKQIRPDHKLRISTDLVQQKNNKPVCKVYIRYEHMFDEIAKDIFAIGRTPELCLADFESQIHNHVDIPAVTIAIETFDSVFTEADKRKVKKLKAAYDLKGKIVKSGNSVIKEVSHGG
jgi:hypothetical protein